MACTVSLYSHLRLAPTTGITMQEMVHVIVHVIPIDEYISGVTRLFACDGTNWWTQSVVPQSLIADAFVVANGRKYESLENIYLCTSSQVVFASSAGHMFASWFLLLDLVQFESLTDQKSHILCRSIWSWCLLQLPSSITISSRRQWNRNDNASPHHPRHPS